ncbi:MAG: type I DNA topoisomerase [Clostridia bacterium]|nr:type I DNA topoisomerase [Clostridia bacterium]
MSKLVIVESPTKAKTIAKFLGAQYKVLASNGHVADLPKSVLGVDVDNGFAPKYITLRGRGDVLDRIRTEAKKADQVFLATDPDREGEAISWHLARLLKLADDSDCRIEFNEITPKAVKNAIKHPRAININLVDAQQARRVLDRLVGYKISPILWRKVKRGLSAGRVQSVATRIICDKEREIQGFVPQEYWIVTAMLTRDGIKKPVLARFYGFAGKKAELSTEDSVRDVMRRIDGTKFVVAEVRTNERKRHALPPFTTSSLQQETSRKLSLTTQMTMMVAQQLYEGIDVLGKGPVGLITYMRTDSVRVSSEAQSAALSYIQDKYGDAYVPEKPNFYKGRANAQDAHEAIRPSDVSLTPEKIKKSLTSSQYRVYKLIYDRFIASQMASQTVESTTVSFDANGCTFRATGERVLFDGWTAVYTEGMDAKHEKEQLLPRIAEGEQFNAVSVEPEQKFTQPPSRYTEATLVKLLEEKGIGRPSTYAPTISAIINRRYVKREKKQLVPTDLGFVVTELMQDNFENIVSLEFTAEMEEMLDHIEHGEVAWNSVIADFYGPFIASVERASESIERIVIPDEESDIVCDKCGGIMVYKEGRFGRFLACKNYPECKNTMPILEPIGVPCPKCGKDIVVKRSRAGRTFYGCSGYPECDFAVGQKPVNKKCSHCGAIMVVRYGRTVCSNSECVKQRSAAAKQKAEQGDSRNE